MKQPVLIPSKRAVSAFLLALLLSGGRSMAEEATWVGKEVLTKERTAQFRTTPDSQETFETTLASAIGKVEKEKGEYVCVLSAKGKAWLAKGDAVLLEDAVAYFTRRLQWDESDLGAYWERAAASRAIKQFDKAATDLTELLRQRPETSEVLAFRGNVWADKGDFDKALADFTDALRLDPSSVATRYDRAHLWRDKGEYEKALSDCREAIRLDPRNANAYSLCGEIHIKRHEYEEALADCTRALDIRPKDGRFLVNRSVALVLTRDLDKALVDVNDAITSDPNYYPAYLQRASLLMMGKVEYGKALDDCRKYLQGNPCGVDSLVMAALILAACPDAKLRDGKEACRLARKACELSAWSNPIALDAYAAACAEVGEYEEAIKWEKKTLEFPDWEKENGEEVRLLIQQYGDHKPYRLE